ncbi:hypothetical protein H8D57_03175 [bacterium]|nr:hypothetical protein [bacterium]
MKNRYKEKINPLQMAIRLTQSPPRGRRFPKNITIAKAARGASRIYIAS